MAPPLIVVGDIHGHRDDLVRLLRDAGLVGAAEHWSGADSRVWLLGDLIDRGPDGIGAIELVMRLEHESEGRLRCLLGNHDALLVMVSRYPDVGVWPDGTTFRGVWSFNGGQTSDLERLDPHHLDWIERLPALALEDDVLLTHADTDLYLDYGPTIVEICARIGTVLHGGGPVELGRLMDTLSDRNVLHDPARVTGLLHRLGGTRIVHGHTPIAIVTGRDPGEVRGPLVYGGGRVINADHCLFGGGPGFVVRLDGGSGTVA